MSKLKIEGLDDLQEQLREMDRGMKELSRKHEIPLSELFTSAFMRKFTDYSSLDELLEAGGFHAETSEEFEAIPEDAFDAFIAKVSKFQSWDKMLDKATELYLSEKLGF